MSDSGIVTPAFSRTRAAYTPHGTVAPQREIVPTSRRSATDDTFSGLPDLTAICIWLRAKRVGAARLTWPPATRRSMVLRSADAKTSAGAPPWIWATRADDDPKLNVTVAFG